VLASVVTPVAPAWSRINRILLWMLRMLLLLFMTILIVFPCRASLRRLVFMMMSIAFPSHASLRMLVFTTIPTAFNNNTSRATSIVWSIARHHGMV
jgi:hypothetical protein